ncbi:MAG: FeoB-associated Cys-rich membrane protein [Aminipila sp.]
MLSTVIISGVLIVMVFFAVRHLIKSARMGKCAGCSGCSSYGKEGGCSSCNDYARKE